MDAKRFIAHSLKDGRILRILQAALEAVEPGRAVRRSLAAAPLTSGPRTFALSVGKAAIPMLEGLSGALPLEQALAITKHPPGAPPAFRVILGAHPVPDASSLRAGEAALEFVHRLTPADRLLCLLSGGGSALMSASRLPLEELQRLTSALLASGARIDEINILRRHLDSVKGGGLAFAANGAQVISLILSDVVGDPLEAIASGPTAPDPAGIEEARAVLSNYGLNEDFPAVYPALRETLKPGDPVFDRVENRIVASGRIAIQAALAQAKAGGFGIEELPASLQGEAREVGRRLADKLRVRARSGTRPFCMVGGGETTVTLKSPGRGGRNQETALAALPLLDGLENVLFISLATDGEDGPTDAAGAVVTGESLGRALALGLDPRSALEQNNAYPFFDALGDLIRTGPTGTNVNDLVLLVGL